MKRFAVLLAAAAVMLVPTRASAGDGWPVVGTVVALSSAEARVDCDLRVGKVETTELAIKAGDQIKLSWERSQEPQDPRRPGVRLGDQIRVSLLASESEAGKWIAVGDIVYLGRGEFVNPGSTPTEDLGSSRAKVLVKLLAPLHTECHQRTAALLRELARREPERVRVQIFNLVDPVCRQELMREGLTCATVLVNNRYEFTLAQDGGKRDVQLWHRPNTPQSSYNSEDAVAVAEQEIKRLYAGEEPTAEKAAAEEESAPAAAGETGSATP